MDDMDPIERRMDCRVENMTAAELATYIKTYLYEVHDIDLPMDGIVERKTLEAFQRRYPDGKAGQIVQWVMLHHKGRRNGEFVSTAVFSKGMKWWTDKMYMEMQQHSQRRRRHEADEETLKGQFFDLGSLT